MARLLVWFWSGGGGGSQFAARLAHRLTLEFGPDVVRLSMRADDPTIASAEANGVRVLRADVVSDRNRPLTTLAQLSKGAAILEQHAKAVDVVLIAMNFAMAAPLSLTLNKPMVYCAHDPEPHPGDYAQFGQRFTQAALIARATTVVALSEYAKTLLAKYVPASRLRLVPLSSVFEPCSPVSPMPDGKTHLLMPGRMIAYKGLDLLADALAPFAARDDWRLTIAGDGPALTPELVARFQMPQLELLKKGVQSPADMASLYASTDVVLAPYRSATQSGVVAEALACGKPCIVSAAGALSEQIGYGKAGWIARTVSAEAVSSTLAQALADAPARADKSAGACRLARDAWNDNCWSWLSSLNA